jgi:hypothetical protein
MGPSHARGGYKPLPGGLHISWTATIFYIGPSHARGRLQAFTRGAFTIHGLPLSFTLGLHMPGGGYKPLPGGPSHFMDCHYLLHWAFTCQGAATSLYQGGLHISWTATIFYIGPSHARGRLQAFTRGTRGTFAFHGLPLTFTLGLHMPGGGYKPLPGGPSHVMDSHYLIFQGPCQVRGGH